MTTPSTAPSDQDAPDPRDQMFDVSDVTKGLGAKTGRSAITVLVFAAAKILIALGTTAVLARLVPPAEQGIIAMAMPAVLIATGLSEFGLAQAIVQRPHVTHRLASTLLWTNVALGLSLAVAVALLGTPAAQFYGEPAMVVVFAGLAPYILFTVLTAQYVAVLRRQMRIRQIEIVGFVALCGSSALAILAALLGAGYWALAVQLVMTEFLSLIYLIFVTRWVPSGPLNCRFGEARSALSFGGFLAAERILGEFARNMQVIVIGRMFSTVEAGYFFRSLTIAQMPQRRIISPLSGAFLPSLSRLQDDPAGFQDMYVRQISRANLIMVPLGLVICSCADVMVRVMLGPDWDGAVPILAWLGLLPMTALTLTSFSWVLVACGRSKQLFLFRIFSTILLLTSLLVGARYGVVGLVAAYMITLAFIQGPLLAAVAVRYSPLSVGALRRTLLGEALFACVSGAILLGLRRVMELESMALEALIVLVVLTGLMGIRIMSNPGLRGDVTKALKVRAARKA